MCLPLAVAAAAVSAAGTLVGGIQAMQQGNYESKLARRNAAMEIEAARDSQDLGRDEARNLYRQVGQLKGEQIAAMAANGIDVGYGSALRTSQDTAALADEDATNLYRNVKERTRGFEINASNYVAQAKAAKAQGRAALIGSVFQAGSSLMGGFQQQSTLKAKMGIGRSPAPPTSYIRGSFGGGY